MFRLARSRRGLGEGEGEGGNRTTSPRGFLMQGSGGIGMGEEGRRGWRVDGGVCVRGQGSEVRSLGYWA